MLSSIKNYREKVKNQEGLTLIEILAVVVLIGLIILFLITRVNSAGDKTNEMGVKTDFRTFQVASEQTLRDTKGELKDGSTIDDAMLNELLDAGLQFTSKVSAKKDPWGTAYTVTYEKATSGLNADDGTESGNGKVVITSNGKDKSAGTADDIIMATYYHNGNVTTCTNGYTGDKDLTAEGITVASCGGAITP